MLHFKKVDVLFTAASEVTRRRSETVFWTSPTKSTLPWWYHTKLFLWWETGAFEEPPTLYSCTHSETSVSTVQLSGSHSLLYLPIGSVWIYNRTVNGTVEIKHPMHYLPVWRPCMNAKLSGRIVQRHESSTMATIMGSRLLIITNADCMEQSLSWETNRRPTLICQEIPRLLWNPKFHDRVHNSPPTVPIQRHMNPVQTLPHYLLMAHFNIILPPTSRFSECCRPFKICKKNLTYFLSLQCVLHALLSSSLIWPSCLLNSMNYVAPHY
jgi:hypothetical protein